MWLPRRREVVPPNDEQVAETVLRVPWDVRPAGRGPTDEALPARVAEFHTEFAGGEVRLPDGTRVCFGPSSGDVDLRGLEQLGEPGEPALFAVALQSGLADFPDNQDGDNQVVYLMNDRGQVYLWNEFTLSPYATTGRRAVASLVFGARFPGETPKSGMKTRSLPPQPRSPL